MIRKSLPWVVMLCLVTIFVGCAHKQPITAPAAVQAHTAPAPPPATEVRPARTPAAPPPADPMLSSDMQVVNGELHRRGFTPDVYFDFDKSELKSDARAELQRNAGLLRTYDHLDLMIEGNCDERGTAEYNLALGERRANAVKSYLSSLGVAGQRMRTLSYGSERPVCTEHQESCWSQNRRDHMVVSGRSTGGSIG
ncbi:MAG TPA: peptidoglycan-associated lipoprotein Pal [Thermoanaerobaculia bacterium]|jgi:peptidoglycan-associated lipoprotein|nr:peptidoglycan-associated lipoprotein Pal [Thermoanaerobaculia bacterium]